MIHFSFSRNIPIGAFANGMTSEGLASARQQSFGFSRTGRQDSTNEYSGTRPMGSSSQVSPNATTEGRAVPPVVVRIPQNKGIVGT